MASSIIRWLFVASALGEMAVGLAVAAWPGPVMGVLLGAPVAGTAAVAACMGGIAVAALGASWWVGRPQPGDARPGRLAASYLGYNAGVGLLFLAHACSAESLLVVAWAVAATHLAAAVIYAAALFARAGRRH